MLDEDHARTLPEHRAAFAAVFVRLGVGNFPPLYLLSREGGADPSCVCG
jgi:hypothetical protein